MQLQTDYIVRLFHPKHVEQRVQHAMDQFPVITDRVAVVLTNAPYLVALFGVVGLMDLTTRVESLPSPEPATGAIVMLVLILLANGLCYLEAGYRLDYSPQRSITYLLKRLPRLFVITFLTLAFIFTGLLFLVIPGVYIAGRFSFAMVAAIIEDKGIRESFRTSINITGGNLTLVYLAYGSLGLFVVILFITMGLTPTSIEPAIIAIIFTLIPVLLHTVFGVLYVLLMTEEITAL